MQKQFSILLTFLFFAAKSGFAQQSGGTHPNHIFIELGGNAPIMSLNYERRLSEANNGFGLRAGIGIAGLPGHIFPQLVTTIPMGITYLVGKGPHHLDLGAGLTIGTEAFGDSDFRNRKQVFFVPSVGYRLQNISKGFVLRIFASPLVGGDFSAGVSFGRRF